MELISVKYVNQVSKKRNKHKCIDVDKYSVRIRKKFHLLLLLELTLLNPIDFSSMVDYDMHIMS